MKLKNSNFLNKYKISGKNIFINLKDKLLKKYFYISKKKYTLTGLWQFTPVLFFVLLLVIFTIAKGYKSSSKVVITTEIVAKCKLICDQLNSCISEKFTKETIAYKDILVSGCYVKCPKHSQKINECFNLDKSSCEEKIQCITSKLIN